MVLGGRKYQLVSFSSWLPCTCVCQWLGLPARHRNARLTSKYKDVFQRGRLQPDNAEF
uniref:Uncharacterized protein n=1 Tax=Crocodylus porosus TaxID=8502 RepID=A0A7M4DZT0_CROPO